MLSWLCLKNTTIYPIPFPVGTSIKYVRFSRGYVIGFSLKVTLKITIILGMYDGLKAKKRTSFMDVPRKLCHCIHSMIHYLQYMIENNNNVKTHKSRHTHLNSYFNSHFTSYDIAYQIKSSGKAKVLNYLPLSMFF